jgi:arabinose-5-phosphate isomerase
MIMDASWRLKQAETVLREEAQAILGLLETLGSDFSDTVGTILDRPGKVAVTGMGKSGHVAGKIAATLASTGTPAFFLHPGEAVHGDLGVLDDGDTVLALSKSGETQEILDLIPLLRRLGIPILAMVCARESTLAREADQVLYLNVDRETGPLGLAPTSSTTAMLAMGDALAMVLLEEREFDVPDFAQLHPGGMLGRRFYLRVRELMHVGEALPVVGPETSLRQAIMVMTAKKLGIATVCSENGDLMGILTDGDLRRILEQVAETGAAEASFLGTPVSRYMTTHPVVVEGDMLASEAVAIMEARKISHLIVSSGGHLEGVLHFHDCLRAKVV